jgi:membrane-bound serine protease (ClpP class)
MMQRLMVIVMAGWIGGAGAPKPVQVGLIRIDGAIGPATANYIARAVDVAAAERDECLIIQLDTPGGLLESTKRIVQTFYAAKVPVVVYVAPAGAVASSAGVFVTLAADIAAMAPNTTIGAAHPVQIGTSGGAEPTDDVMKTKLENYASSFIESIANRRHRNVEWARSAVLQSVATTAEKALDLKVIDLIADDMPQLLQRVDGRTVGDRTLHTANATVVEIPMSSGEQLFQLIWRPEVMFLLMLVAIYGIIGELSSPGAILPGVAGAIAVVLLLFMSATLPVNIAGLALIGLAVALFIIDAFAPTHGVLTAGGILAFFLGALLLFSHTGPGFRLSLAWIIPATVITAAFFMFGVAKGIQAQFQPVRVGKETMLGRIVTAGSRIDSQGGTVFIEGERWNAISDSPVEAGQAVEVTAIEGLTLKVEPQSQHVEES